MDNISEEFMHSYAEWEQYLKARYGQRDMHKLSQRFWRDEAAWCKKEEISENQLLGLVNVRNARAHSPWLLEIKDYALLFLKKLVNTFCRKAIDIAVPREKIYKATLRSGVWRLLKEMNMRLYTHVPVVEKEKFYGVFSENTLLKIVATERWKNDLRIADIIDVLHVPSRSGADGYEFLPDDATFYHVYRLFQSYIDQGKRLGVVFLSKGGKESGVIEGLITAWDLHKGLNS